MKVLFLTKYYYEGPSSRYRSYNYKSFFEDENIEVTYKPLFFDGYVTKLYKKEKNSKIEILFSFIKRFIFLIFKARQYNHIIIEKELFPYFPYWMEKILLLGKNYSLDFDDNPKYRYKKNKILNFIFGNKIDLLVSKAKFVTVGNKWYYEDFPNNNHLVYLPTVIDINKYDLSYKNQLKKDNNIRIVWIGSPSGEKNIEKISNVLKNLSKKYFNIILTLIGSNLSIEGVNVENIKWSEENEVKKLMESDIGIMPLEDGYWEKGKCGFKLIQYMACGLPVIANSVSANKEIIDNTENGFLVNSDEEWFKYLEILINDEQLRNSMGLLGRKKIEKKYSYQLIYKEYIEIIRSKSGNN